MLGHATPTENIFEIYFHFRDYWQRYTNTVPGVRVKLAKCVLFNNAKEMSA